MVCLNNYKYIKYYIFIYIYIFILFYSSNLCVLIVLVLLNCIKNQDIESEDIKY